MRNTKTHSGTFKKRLNKCKNIFYAYSELQYKYADVLDANSDVVEIRCNVPLLECALGEKYTSDFYCIKVDGNAMVRECVTKDKLLKPMTIKMLDASRNYWLSKGVLDWGIVLDDCQRNLC